MLNKMQSMRDDGMVLQEIAKACNCSISYVYNHTLSPKRFKSDTEKELDEVSRIYNKLARNGYIESKPYDVMKGLSFLKSCTR